MIVTNDVEQQEQECQIAQPAWRIHGYAQRGRREHLEDAWFASSGVTPHGAFAVAAVADGVGGLDDGQHASQATIRSLASAVGGATDSSEAQIRAALANANEEVLALDGPATTVVLAAICDDALSVAWAGDSRAYIINQAAGSIRCITDDHADHQIDSFGHSRQVITRWIGSRDVAEPDLATLTLADGDELVLTTDGVHGVLSDEAILEVIELAGAEANIGAHLVAAALAAGSSDNCTAVVLASATPTRKTGQVASLASATTRSL